MDFTNVACGIVRVSFYFRFPSRFILSIMVILLEVKMRQYMNIIIILSHIINLTGEYYICCENQELRRT